MSQRRSALGRGLGALISGPPQPAEAPSSGRTVPPPTATPPPSAPIIGETQFSVDTETRHSEANSDASGPLELDIAKIDPNPDQPRREFDPVALQQLAESIGQHGVLQPVVVRRAGDRFELIMGERRFRASQLAGRTTVPAVVHDATLDDRLELAIIENVQRQDLNPIELAHAYQALADAGHTQDEIGRKVSMDRSSIANHLRLLELSRGIQTDVENGRLTMGHAKALLQVPDVERREALRTRVLAESLSVRATERAARDLKDGANARTQPKKVKQAPAAALDPDTRAFVEQIERRLQTKVALHPTPDGGGRLEINFFSLEDLERIGGMLLGDAE